MSASDTSRAAERPDVPATTEEVVETEGAAPDRAAAPQRPGAVIARLFCPDTESRFVSLDEIAVLVDDDAAFLWVDLADYAADDLRAVAQALHLHRIAVHAALASWTRPQLDVFDDQFYVAATVPTLDVAEYRIRAHQLDLVVGRNFLVSAHKMILPFADRVLERAQQNPALLHHDAAYLLYILLDEMLAYYEGLAERLHGEIEVMQERALTDTSDNYLRDLLRAKRFAFAISELANQHREVFGAFLRPDFTWVSGEDVDVYFRDLHARLERLGDELRTLTTGLTDAFNIYVSHVAHRTNNVMKILTMISAILLPTTVILGFFGTNNLQGLPLLTATTGFALEVLSIALISVAIVWIFRHKKWL